ncbi:MAG: DNA polymerase II large subunit [Candidatus Micrarchaeaceae archaeon]
MTISEYFAELESKFNKEYALAKEARSKGYDAENNVEITPAPDIAGRVEGLIGLNNLGRLIRSKIAGRSRSELAFEMVKEICTNEAFENSDTIKRILLAVRVGLAILTEGVLVAPTEGVQGIGHYRNADNSDYISVVYAGPIRGAGGTAAALSVALADYARQFFNIGAYKATQDEIERYIEEVEIYNADILRLQYMPSEEDLRSILESCPVCVDGLASEQLEVNVHTNISRIGIDGKEIRLENRIRSGVPLVLSNIILKAKAALRETKKVGLDWSWLNKVIKIDKPASPGQLQQDSNEETFLEELVAGRPILAYPNHIGGFRLRYGRSRLTGIAAKGFSPATMIILDSFIGIGTQLKVELPGKGCVAMPVDTIEGPFVRLKSGEALRINTAKEAERLKNDVEAIISVGDILITFGDFKKSNTPLAPSSYVEELWRAQLLSKGFDAPMQDISFEDAYALSLKYDVPMHPKYLFEFQAVTMQELRNLAASISASQCIKAKSLNDIKEMRLANTQEIKDILERLNVPHVLDSGEIVIEQQYAKSLLVCLGFFSDKESKADNALENFDKALEKAQSALEIVNAVSGIKLAKRSTFIGARVGRPEKARERMMQAAPNALFPISMYGGRDRNISNAYAKEASKFSKQNITVEIARYKCDVCNRVIGTPYCYDCGRPARIEPGEDGKAYGDIEIDIDKAVSGAVKRLGLNKIPDVVKGVKGLINKNKIAEPIEKGILRAMHNIYVYKDGTTRFDATDAPITHFYPIEIGTDIETLKRLGYATDYENRPLESADQLVELKHQDVILNRRGAEYFLRVAQFIDDLLEKYYGMARFYNAEKPEDIIGNFVITLSPHTSCAVLNRVIGISDANVGFAHPYTISARRRNTDGDEDTTMLLLDALLNFSRKYLPASVGGSMDAPLLLTTKVVPEEVDDEVHSMEAVTHYPLEFYEKTFAKAPPGEVKLDLVESRLGTETAYYGIGFTHLSTAKAIEESPKRSKYVLLKTMREKISEEFRLLDMLYSLDKRDTAKRLILSHFIPDLMGNLHSFSKQRFRCVTCNAKYRRMPLIGKCPKDGGRLLLTISKGGIEKYLNIAIELADRYNLDTYTKQRLQLLKEEIISVFGSVTAPEEQQSKLQLHAKQEIPKGQFDLSKFA